ncbi:hypothetical protein ACX93W_03495 [Paenibacillus sp. CAU 1782]
MAGIRGKSFYMLLIIAVAIGILAAPPERASACSCVVNGSVQETLANHDAVFEGIVTGKKRPSTIFSSSSADPVTWTFRVNEVWKGKVTSTLSVTSAESGASCGFEFEEGKRYLVYARDNGKSLDVSLCSRTVDFNSASADLTELGTGSTPPQQPAAADNASSFLWWIALAVAALVAVAGAIIIYRRRPADRP